MTVRHLGATRKCRLVALVLCLSVLVTGLRLPAASRTGSVPRHPAHASRLFRVGSASLRFDRGFQARNQTPVNHCPGTPALAAANVHPVLCCSGLVASAAGSPIALARGQRAGRSPPSSL